MAIWRSISASASFTSGTSTGIVLGYADSYPMNRSSSSSLVVPVSPISYSAFLMLMNSCCSASIFLCICASSSSVKGLVASVASLSSMIYGSLFWSSWNLVCFSKSLIMCLLRSFCKKAILEGRALGLSSTGSSGSSFRILNFFYSSMTFSTTGSPTS